MINRLEIALSDSIFSYLNQDKENIIINLCGDDGKYSSPVSWEISNRFPKCKITHQQWYRDTAIGHPFDQEIEIPYKLGEIYPHEVNPKLTIVDLLCLSDSRRKTFTIRNRIVNMDPMRYDCFHHCVLNLAEWLDIYKHNYCLIMPETGKLFNPDIVCLIMEGVFQKDISVNYFAKV